MAAGLTALLFCVFILIYCILGKWRTYSLKSADLLKLNVIVEACLSVVLFSVSNLHLH